VQGNLSFTSIKPTLKTADENLVFSMKFYARKPAQIPMSLVVQRNTGGVWKFQVSLIFLIWERALSFKMVLRIEEP